MPARITRSKIEKIEISCVEHQADSLAIERERGTDNFIVTTIENDVETSVYLSASDIIDVAKSMIEFAENA